MNISLHKLVVARIFSMHWPQYEAHILQGFIYILFKSLPRINNINIVKNKGYIHHYTP